MCSMVTKIKNTVLYIWNFPKDYVLNVLTTEKGNYVRGWIC